MSFDSFSMFLDIIAFRVYCNALLVHFSRRDLLTVDSTCRYKVELIMG